jgi:hypothetical protein
LGAGDSDRVRGAERAAAAGDAALGPIAYLDKISSPLAVPSTSSIDSIGTVIHSMLVMCLQALSWLGMDEFDPTGYVISL